MSKSSLALNNLRGFLILMVLAFHSFIAYLSSQPAVPFPFDTPPYSWIANPIIDGDRWIGFDLFCACQFLYLMQLMFFLSGLLVWPSLRRKGAKAFLSDRFLRLGVPFVLGAYLLMPVVYYPVYRVGAVDPSWSAFWSHWTALPFWPNGPAWFLWFLLLLNVTAAALFALAPRAGEQLSRMSARAGVHPSRFFIALAGVSALAYLPLSSILTPWYWVEFGPFAFQPSFAPQYVIYFAAGLALGASGLDRDLLAPEGPLARGWARWLIGALASFVLWIIPTALIVKGPGATLPGLQIAADLGLVLFAASACFGLTGTFLRFAGAFWPTFDSLSTNGYGIYLIHYLFVIWLQYLLLGVALVAIFKGAIVFAGTVVLSWAATAAVCRTSVGARLLRGQRRLALAAAPPPKARYPEVGFSE
jgi:peptidoglycan/LPS O-acetylase OafA/YrhL